MDASDADLYDRIAHARSEAFHLASEVSRLAVGRPTVDELWRAADCMQLVANHFGTVETLVGRGSSAKV
jgi:hypothetical protein